MMKKIYRIILKVVRPIIMKKGGSVTVWVKNPEAYNGKDIFVFWRKEGTQYYEPYFAMADLSYGWYAIGGYNQEYWEKDVDKWNVMKIRVSLGA